MSKAEMAAYRAGIAEVRRLARARYEARLTEAANNDPTLLPWMAEIRARAIRYAFSLPTLPAEWIGTDTPVAPPYEMVFSTNGTISQAEGDFAEAVERELALV